MKKIIIPIIILFILLLFIPLLSGVDNTDLLLKGQDTSLIDSSGSLLDNTTSAESSVSSDVSDNENNTNNTETNNEFILLDKSNGKLIKLSEFDYVCGAVASEMPASYGDEALKAQAIASYTNAYRLRAIQLQNPDPDLKGAHLDCDTSKNYGYLSWDKAKERWGDNYETYKSKIEAAVKAVENKLLTYNGEAILAAYHAISNGKTEKSSLYWGTDLPYLQPVDSAYDKEAENYQTSISITKDELENALSEQFPSIKITGDPSSWITNLQLTDSGSVIDAQICNNTITGAQLRTLLNLRSACFTIEPQDDCIKLIVKGYGHGIGMSQYGAGRMAADGKTWEEIVKHYYTGIEITDKP